MTRTRDEVLRDALAHLTTTERYATRDLDDQLVIDAICMRLSAGIETLATLDTADRENLFGDTWPLMWGMRNRIAHGYLLVDSAIIRQTLQDDVPEILDRIRRKLSGPDAAAPGQQRFHS